MSDSVDPTLDNPVDIEKQRIRSLVRAERGALTTEDHVRDAEGLLEQLRMLVIARGAKRVSCYYPVVSEPNTLLFLEWALEEGLEVLLPISREDGLLDWVPYESGSVEPGMYGIPEPSGEPLSPLAVSEVDIMLIPACAVDQQGNRLGWGRGYFDKSLGSMDNRPPVFAIVRDEEVLDSVPTEVHDQPVTGVITPTRILHFEE